MTREEIEKKRDELAPMENGRAPWLNGWAQCSNLLMPEIEQLRAQLAERDKEIERLKARTCSHGDYKVWGTDGCSSCETGRITIYTLEEKCLKCKGR